jgi:uncharacterized membrane protein YraQ (UPF0718 family)
MFANKRLIVGLLFTVALAVVFWSQSRVPALNEKAQMGLRTDVNAIAFETVIAVSDDQSLAERVAGNSVNWAYTNLQGMTFGVLFAAAVLTVLGSVRRRSFKSPWLNTLSGVALGTPLGVCVNCATPIAQGLYSAGSRLETALATLFSSPTLNVIVVTMSFTLLPWELALTKLAGVLLLLGSIPWLVRRCVPSADMAAAAAVPHRGSPVNAALPSLAGEVTHGESYWRATVASATSFAGYLFYIVKVALPLMLLAGLLGALAVELVPFSAFSTAEASASTLFAAALLATVLPVPIAFDVIIVMTLLKNGVDAGLAAVFLFGLGIYSVYPAFVIARHISARLSLALGAAVIVLASGIGLASQAYFERKADGEQQTIVAGLVAANEAAYLAAVGICDGLPARLQSSCFVQHLDVFGSLVPPAEICAARPAALDAAACKAAVDGFVAEQQALQSASTGPCTALTSAESGAQCQFSVTYQLAMRSQNIDVCNQLTMAGGIEACRAQYLNARLLFSTDPSACAGLAGPELGNCRINATIYRLADSTDFAGCEALESGAAQDHCRYVIVTSMIGRRNDASGCEKIRSSSATLRCKSLVEAWRAEKESNPAFCLGLPHDLEDSCRLRVAAKEIDARVAAGTLLASAAPPAAPAAATRHMSRHAAAAGRAPPLQWTTVHDDGAVAIAFTPHAAPARHGGHGFRKIPAADIGIERSWNFSETDFFEPYLFGKGIASGDFNGDLWPDLALATERGIAVYRNVGGRFELAAVDQGELARANVLLVAFVDADNDGFQDLFASAYGGVNYLLMNSGGGFEHARLVELRGEHRVTLAAGFGDLDGSGELDIVLGNWSSGSEGMFATPKSENRILFREGDGYRGVSLGEVAGETNSVLLADIDGNRHLDVLVGNDWIVPDVYYLGRGHGVFEPVSAASGMFPTTSLFTMSLESADFNNDLSLDLFSTDMSFAESTHEDYCSAIDDAKARSRCQELVEAFGQLQRGSAAVCAERVGLRAQRDCYASYSVRAARQLKDPAYCDGLGGQSPALLSLCRNLAAPVPPEPRIDQTAFPPQAQRNVLLMGQDAGFFEATTEYGVESSSWSWNAKAADLDNDGWQDIYVGNGFHFGDSFYEIQSNVMFRNIAGRHFERVEAAWGLDDAINTPSYVYLDLDLDGDLDIVATGVLAPPRVFLNEQAAGHSVAFVLADEGGNSGAIGATVTIRYGGRDTRQQRKESKLSGGFMSFDHPVMHFGLGGHAAIDSVSVQWPDGETTEYEGRLGAGYYRISRHGG